MRHFVVDVFVGVMGNNDYFGFDFFDNMRSACTVQGVTVAANGDNEYVYSAYGF